MVDMRPSSMPNLSLITLARGARQLVVHEALLHDKGKSQHGSVNAHNTGMCTVIPNDYSHTKQENMGCNLRKTQGLILVPCRKDWEEYYTAN